MEELLLERQLNSKTYLNEDGTRTMKYFGRPIHFDKNGKLEEIDVNFHLNTTSNPAYYLFNTVNNSFRIGLSKNLSIDKSIKFSFRYDGVGDIFTTIKGLALYDSEKDEYTIFEKPQANTGSIENNIAKYPNVFNGMDFEFHSLDDKLKEYIYLNDKGNIPNPTDYGYNPETTYLIVLNELSTNLLELQYNEEQLEVYNEGIQKLISPKEWAKDNDQKDLTILNNYNADTGEYYFGVPYSEIQNANLPITIDPTWQTSGVPTVQNFDCTYEFDSFEGGYYTYPNLTTLGMFPENGGYISQRSMIKFDLSGLLASFNNVVKAYFNFTFQSTNAFYLSILTSYSPNSQNMFENIIPNSTGFLVASSPVDVTAVVKNWLSNPSSNYGFGLDYFGGNTSRIYGLGSGVSTQPYLSIDYVSSVLGFTGLPTSNSIKWTWNALAEAEKYVIYDNNNVKLAEIPSGTLTWTETGLSPNTSYTRKIRYVTGGVEQTPETVASATTYTVLQPVSNLVATNVTSNSATWQWGDIVFGNELAPLFDSGRWSTSSTVTFNSPTKLTIDNTSGSYFGSYVEITVKSNTNYLLNLLKGGTGASTNGYVRITGVVNGVVEATNIANNNTGVAIPFNSGTYSSLRIFFYANYTSGGISFENVSIKETNSGIISYEILDKNGVLLYTTPDGNTKTWTENNLRYSSNYIRQVRVARNGERSSNVQVSVTTSARPINMSAQTITVNPSADTYNNGFNPTINYGTATQFSVGRGASVSYLYKGFLKFPIPLSTDITLNTATLKLYSTTAISTSYNWFIENVNSQWDETTLNYNNMPVSNTTTPLYNVSRAISANIDSDFVLDATLVKNWINNPSSNYGVSIRHNGTTNGNFAQFNSKESADATKIPRLVINYTPSIPPLKPTVLSGAVLSSSSIRWSWSAGDGTATEYRIYNADTDQLIGTSSTSSFDESGVTLGNTYNRYVVAYNSGGESPVTSTTLHTSPLANFRGIPQTATSIKWAFDLFTTVDKVIIYDNNNVKLTEVLSGTTEWVETGLLPNSTYTRKARYVKNGVEDSVYVVVSNNTYATLVVPQSASGVAVNTNTITWSWDDTVNQGITGFEVLDKFNNVKYSGSNTVKSWTSKQLRYGTDYERYVRSVRNGEKSGLVKITARTQDRPANIDEMTTYETLNVSQDVYINSSTPTSSSSTGAISYIGKSGTTLYRYLIKFNTSTIPIGRELKTAKIRIYETSYSGTPSQMGLYKITQSWLDTANWNTQPSCESISIAQIPFSSTTGKYYEANLPIANIQDWANNNNGLLIKSDEVSSGYVQVNTYEGLFQPFLDISHESPIAPLSPSNLQGSIKTGSSILWQWNETTSINAQGYRIYNADNDQLIVELPVGITSYEETGRVMGITYNRYVVAYNSYGESQVVLTSYLFDQSPPTNIVGTPQSSSRIIWTFEPVSGFTEYRIYYFNSTNNTNTLFARVKYENGQYNTYLESNLTTPIGGFGNPQLPRNGLNPNTTETIKVTTVGETYESRYSNSVSATTYTLPPMRTISGQKLGLNNLKWTII